MGEIDVTNIHYSILMLQDGNWDSQEQSKEITGALLQRYIWLRDHKCSVRLTRTTTMVEDILPTELEDHGERR